MKWEIALSLSCRFVSYLSLANWYGGKLSMQCNIVTLGPALLEQLWSRPRTARNP